MTSARTWILYQSIKLPTVLSTVRYAPPPNLPGENLGCMLREAQGELERTLTKEQQLKYQIESSVTLSESLWGKNTYEHELGYIVLVEVSREVAL